MIEWLSKRQQNVSVASACGSHTHIGLYSIELHCGRAISVPDDGLEFIKHICAEQDQRVFRIDHVAVKHDQRRCQPSL